MLHARIDLVPGGQEFGRSTLVDVYIGNDGTGNRNVGHYDVYVEDPRGRPYPREDRPGWVGKIKDFPRSRDQAHASALVALALKMVAATTGSGPGRELARAAEELGGGDAS